MTPPQPAPARSAIREAIEAIYTTTRGDERGECWTIRKFLDAHGVFNDDISGPRRLVAEACKVALALLRDEPAADIPKETT